MSYSGSEQHSDRPAVVVSNDKNNENSNVVEVVYMTTQPKTDLPTHVTVRSTGRPSTVLCEQVYSVSTERIGTYIGECSDKEMENIDIALMISLQLDGNMKTSKKYNETIKEQQEEIDLYRKKIQAMQEALKEKKNEKPEITASSEETIRLQTERDTYKTMYEQLLKASNYDPAQITIACEADCSSGVAAIVKGAGYRLGNEKMKNVSIYLYTGNMRAGLKAAGFEVLTDSKYLTSDAYLLEGDILLNDNAHVATNLTDGAKSSGTGASNTTTVKSDAKVDVAHGFNKSLAGTYKVTASGLNLRAGAGTGKSILAVMKNGEKVQCYGYYNDCNGVKWLYVVYKNIVGYASSKYLSK